MKPNSSRIKSLILTCLLLSLLIQMIPLEISRAEAPILIERGKFFEIWKNPDGSYTWRSAPTWIWNGSAYVPYIFNETDKYYQIQTGLIGARIFKSGYAVFYDPNVTEVRVPVEIWSLEFWDGERWKPILLDLKAKFDVVTNSSGVFINVTRETFKPKGVFSVTYAFRVGKPLKHFVSWVNLEVKSQVKVRVKQNWELSLLISRLKVKEKDKSVMAVLEGINKTVKAKAFHFYDEKGKLLVFEDQSDVADKLKPVSIDLHKRKVTYTFGEWILNSSEALKIDPTTYTATPPTDDAYVSSDYPNNNYGSSENLRARYFADLEAKYPSYLKFDISSLPSGITVTEALLKLYVNYRVTNSPIYVKSASDDWDESTITWNNRASVGTTKLDVVTVNADGWFSWDVTSYVQDEVDAGESYISFYVMVDDLSQDSGCNFDSKEGTNDPQLEITYTYAPSIGEFQAPSKVYANKYFYLNVTINDPNGVSEFKNATIELSNGIILKWDASTDAFSEIQDSNNYCTLDASNSLKTSVNSTAYKLSFKIKLAWNYTEGYLNLTSSNTKVFDVNDVSGSNSWSSNSYFENDLVVNSYTIDLANRVLNATIYFEGSTEPAPNGEIVTYASANASCDSNGIASWDLSSLEDFDYNQEIYGSHISANQTIPLAKKNGHLIMGTSSLTISSITWKESDKQLSFIASGNGTQTIRIKHVYGDKPYYIKIDTQVYQEGSHWSWNNTASTCDIACAFSTHNFLISWIPLASSSSSSGSGGVPTSSTSSSTPMANLPEKTEEIVQTVIKPVMFSIPKYWIGLMILGLMLVSLASALRNGSYNLSIIIGIIIAIYVLNLLCVWLLEPQGLFPQDLAFLKDYLWEPPSLSFEVVGVPTNQIQILQILFVITLFVIFASSIILFAWKD